MCQCDCGEIDLDFLNVLIIGSIVAHYKQLSVQILVINAKKT